MWFLTHIPLNPQVRYKTHDNGYRYVPLTFWYAQITRTCHASQCPTPSKWMNICLGTSGYHFPKAISHNIIELLLWLVAHYPWGKPRVGTTTWHWLWVNPGTCWDVPGISPNDMRQLVDVPNNMGYPKGCGLSQIHFRMSQGHCGMSPNAGNGMSQSDLKSFDTKLSPTNCSCVLKYE